MSETDKQPDPAPQQPDPALMRDENPTRLNLSPKPGIRDISKKPVLIGGGVLLLIAAIATGTFNQAGTNGQDADSGAPEKSTQLPGQLRRDALWYAQVPDSVVRPDPVELPPMTGSNGRPIPDLTGTAVTPAGSVLAQRTTVPALAGQPPQSAPPQLTPEQQAEQQAQQMARQEAAQREQRRQQQLDAALAGGLASANFTPPKPQDPSRGGMQGTGGQGGMVPVSAQQQMAGQMQDDPNGQGRKEQFLKNAKAGMDPAYSSSMKTAARSAFELKGGTVIPAVMVNGINSDLPGQVIGQVRENVFDSKSGQHLLIPQGTKLVGLYDSRVAYGQKRILLVWNRLVFADGSSFDLKGMPGTDKAGFAGFEDLVDNHYFKIFGSAALMSLISAGAQLSQPNNTAGTVSGYAPPSVSQTLGAALGQQIGQTSLAITQKNLNIQPTLEVRPGYAFNVMVTADMILPPIR